MIYSIPMLARQSELTQKASPMPVLNWQWRCVCRPSTTAWLGWLPGRGIVVRFLCQELHPKRTAVTPLSYVHCDSAVEIFLTFMPGAAQAVTPYINFEVNPNGVLYASTGIGRTGRAVISMAEYQLADVHADIKDDAWQAEWLIPLAVLRRVSGIWDFSHRIPIGFNLYKISEDPAIEHYGSFAPVQGDTPDFHRPDCFAKGVLCCE